MGSQNFLKNLISLTDSGRMIQTIVSWFLSHGIKILLILAGAYFVNRFLTLFIQRILHERIKNHIGQDRIKRVDTLVGIFNGTTRFLVAIVVLTMVLSELGVDVGPILAGIGLAGLAVGMAAKDVISDFISGIFIIIEDHYNKGDKVKIAGLEGKVEEITLRRTIIQDESGVFHSIPNSQIKIVSKASK